MSAQYIYDTAPLGSLIRYSNGEPRPPERFRCGSACKKDPVSGVIGV